MQPTPADEEDERPADRDEAHRVDDHRRRDEERPEREVVDHGRLRDAKPGGSQEPRTGMVFRPVFSRNRVGDLINNQSNQRRQDRARRRLIRATAWPVTTISWRSRRAR